MEAMVRRLMPRDVGPRHLVLADLVRRPRLNAGLIVEEGVNDRPSPHTRLNKEAQAFHSSWSARVDHPRLAVLVE
ncbi:MAG TPA: hypothetical protein VFG62_07275, partial [Rhodopila sp.]|nr:hypothetical protein [Rhodopila sp.]